MHKIKSWGRREVQEKVLPLGQLMPNLPISYSSLDLRMDTWLGRHVLLCFVLNEVTVYSWQRDECARGNDGQLALAKVSKAERPVAELTWSIVLLDHSSQDFRGRAKARQSLNVAVLKEFKSDPWAELCVWGRALYLELSYSGKY